MLDINFIKENTQKVADAIKNKNLSGSIDLEELLKLYDSYLDTLKKVEEKRAKRNEITKEIPKYLDTKHAYERQKLMQEATQLKKDLQELESKLAEDKEKYEELLLLVPNIYSEDMPVGKGEEDNIVLKVWVPEKGYLEFDKNPEIEDVSFMKDFQKDINYKDHVEIGEYLDIIDVKQSAKVSGSRFCYLKGDLCLLQDALSLLFKKELQLRNFIPLIPPLLVKSDALYGTSHFPRGRDQVYQLDSDNVEEGQELYLIGSSEPSNFSYFRDKNLSYKELPIKVYAQTPCFRSEVGSWGKDVRGIKRVHQFDKLEMNALGTKEQIEKIFKEFLSLNEWLYQQLELPYRVINKCTGDCGYPASYLQYDVEVWRPAEKEFMEVASNTITTDYQARNLNIKYKDDNGENKFVHTANDTGIPFGRVLIAILENNQQEDGTVIVPKALVKYTGFEKIVPKK